MEYVKLREIFAEALKDKQIVGTMFGGKIYRARKATGSEDYFILAPKKRNRGWYLSGIEGRIGKFEGIIEPKESRKSEADKWADSWKKAGKMLLSSELWPEVLEEIQTCLSIGFEKMQLAYAQYWKEEKGKSYADNKRENAEKIRIIDERLTGTSEKGEIYAKTNLLFHYAEKATIKKMNFGILSEIYLKDIAEAMKDKKPISRSGRTSYDVSFSYQPENKRAFYSEEFRGCGNGHYYIAISDAYALFMEDD
jgi:hypothetical protein